MLKKKIRNPRPNRHRHGSSARHPGVKKRKLKQAKKIRIDRGNAKQHTGKAQDSTHNITVKNAQTLEHTDGSIVKGKLILGLRIVNVGLVDRLYKKKGRNAIRAHEEQFLFQAGGRELVELWRDYTSKRPENGMPEFISFLKNKTGIYDSPKRT